MILEVDAVMMQYTQWDGFRAGNWQREIDVRSFIQKNYTLYELSLIHI